MVVASSPTVKWSKIYLVDRPQQIMSQSFAAVVLVLWCDCHWSRTFSGGLMDQFVVCDHLAGEKHWSAETMNSWACPSKSLEYIKVLEWCTSEWISRLGLVQVYDVLWTGFQSCLLGVIRLLRNVRYFSDYDLIHIFGENNQDFPGSVGWNPVKEFCSAPIWDVRWKYRRGVNVQRTFILFFSPTLCFLISVFILPSCFVSLPVLPDVWLCDAWLTSIFFSFWFIALCHNDFYPPRFYPLFSQDEVFVKRLNLFLGPFCLITYTNEFHLKSTNSLEDQVRHLLTTIILYASQKIHLNQKKITRTRARTARFVDLKHYFNWSTGPMYHFLNMKRQIGDAYKALYLSAETHVLVGPSACL